VYIANNDLNIGLKSKKTMEDERSNEMIKNITILFLNILVLEIDRLKKG
tara:strand:+ start:792 stop:938 length:147 start_codon:yes stop_codon:yes gene_type:complete